MPTWCKKITGQYMLQLHKSQHIKTKWLKPYKQVTYSSFEGSFMNASNWKKLLFPSFCCSIHVVKKSKND